MIGRRFTHSALLFSLLPLSQAMGQVSFGGQPHGLQANTLQLQAPPLASMPEVDVAALYAEDEAREAEGAKGPYRFGFNHAVDLGTDNSGAWHVLDNGDRVWQLAVECPGAYSVNMEFHDYVIPEGGMVFVYNDAGDVLGGFTAESNPGHQSLGVDLLPGDRVVVEYQEPANVAGLGHLRIGQVTHGYRDLFGLDRNLGSSGSCNNNVICPVGDPWRDQIRSVAMIVSGGGGICTGQLVNNCEEDGTPYFLTARHCLVGQVTNWVFRFNWESPTCTPTANSSWNSLSGAQLLAQNQSSDMALLLLNSTPPEHYNVFYSGWDRTNTAPTSSVAIHHPRADIKKISFDNNPAVSATFGWPSAQCWRVLNWEDGTTEQGSSGSGLWNQDGLLVGQLYGGEASCQNNVNDFYGKFSTSWSALAPHLGNCGDQLQGWPVSNTSVDEVHAPAQPVVAPNPAREALTIMLSGQMARGGEYRVMDLLGRTVMAGIVHAGAEQLRIPMEGASAGQYLVHLQGGDTRWTSRFSWEDR